MRKPTIRSQNTEVTGTTDERTLVQFGGESLITVGLKDKGKVAAGVLCVSFVFSQKRIDRLQQENEKSICRNTRRQGVSRNVKALNQSSSWEEQIDPRTECVRETGHCVCQPDCPLELSRAPPTPSSRQLRFPRSQDNSQALHSPQPARPG